MVGVKTDAVQENADDVGHLGAGRPAVGVKLVDDEMEDVLRIAGEPVAGFREDPKANPQTHRLRERRSFARGMVNDFRLEFGRDRNSPTRSAMYHGVDFWKIDQGYGNTTKRADLHTVDLALIDQCGGFLITLTTWVNSRQSIDYTRNSSLFGSKARELAVDYLQIGGAASMMN
jgi:hypothetical protein